MLTFIKYLKSILYGYSQIFFSKSLTFSIFLIIITFIFPKIGLIGTVSLLSALFFSRILQLSKDNIFSGYYNYNALLVGLGLGSYYEYGIQLIILSIFAGFLSLLIQLFLDGILYKYRLYVLSFPFLLTMWIVELSARNFGILTYSSENIYMLNNVFEIGGPLGLQLYDKINNEILPSFIKYYFVSLGSIFFQDNVIAGILIFIGLIIFSRIATSLSILGYISAYFFMELMGINITNIPPFFIGFNFILTSIAIGGYFVIPSFFSYLWVIVLSPIVVLITLGFTNLLNLWQIPVYTLPFNLVVTLFIYALYNRTGFRKKLIETVVQEFVPEKNLYSYYNYKRRFGDILGKIHLLLPFWGEWTVWQGYNGKHTHKDNYKYALDFVITYNGKTYNSDGSNLENYYCYDKLVLSPGYGTVIKIIDNIDDNPIGIVNTINNWGNSIIIKHNEFLYSQLSHLKANSILVREGEYVKPGQPLAKVGNSGRSPQPHLHFQVQTYQYLGSYPIPYPFSRYVLKNNNEAKLKIFSIPQEGDIVENPSINNILFKAFRFLPGQIIEILLTLEGTTKLFKWEVFTDSNNNSYIYCHTTSSFAYFYNDGLTFYFKSYVGKKNNPLYYFFLSCFRIEFYQTKTYFVEDEFPLHRIFPNYFLFLHDIIAPFMQLIKSKYRLTGNFNVNFSGEIQMNAEIVNLFLNKKLNSIKSSIYIDKQGIKTICFNKKNKEFFIKFIFKDKYE
jgi:urea transporter/murein DD-endopeptidase MepM/ murein hydrolase activator NlpD